MIAAETSDAAGGNFLDVKKCIAGQNDLKAWPGELFRLVFMRLKHPRGQCPRAVRIGRLRVSKMCQRAHMKSFSLFYRRVYVVLGSLDEHRCSRITVSAWRSMFI